MPPRPPPASLLASATPWRRHAAPSGLSQLPPVLIPFSCSPSRSAPRTERSRRHRRRSPRPPSPSRLPDASQSSAVPPSTSSTSHATRRAPSSRHRHHPQASAPAPFSVDSATPARPRAHSPSLQLRGEPLTRFPLSPCPTSLSSRRSQRAENPTPPAKSPPSLQPARLETEHGTVLLASSGARRAP